MEFMKLKNTIETFFRCYKKQISVKELMKKLEISSEYTDLILDSLYSLEREGKIFFDKNFTYMHVPTEFFYVFGELKKSNTNQYYVNFGNGNRVLIRNIGKAKVGDYVFVSKEEGAHPKCFQGKIRRVVKRESINGNSNYIVKELLKKDGNHYYINVCDSRVYISRECLHTAFAGDLVNVKIQDGMGSVIEVLNRHCSSHVFRCVSVDGVLKWIPIGASYGFFELNNHKYHEGDMVVATIKGIKLNILQELGDYCSIENDINALILDYGFDHIFSTTVLEEAKLLSCDGNVTLEDNRVDLRNLETFTIDPVGAKDLDDAVSLVCDDDVYHLYVHTANPSHYIKMDSYIFNEAFKRGFSIYPTTDVIPMLPDVFSSGVCSLNEFGDKYAITCRLDIDKQGNIIDFDLFKSIIRNDKQMNYDDVNAFLNGDENKEYLPFSETLFKMLELSSILEKKKQDRGAISFDGDEKHFILDENKNPIDIVEEQRGEAELIIENLMLIANERITQYAFDLGLPFIYRNHEKPTVQKEANLKKNLVQKGYFIQKIGNIERPEILQSFLNNLLKGKKKEEKRVICEMVLKTMTRAYYDDKNVGHYGLALDCYGTFTSPARKISDLINHMIIEEFLDNHDIESEKMNQYRDFVRHECEYISLKQKDADMLETEINHLMLSRYSSNFINMEVNARILFINRYGIYIKDEHGLTGVIPIHRNMVVHGQSVHVFGHVYHVNEQIKVVLKKKDDNELIYDFGVLKEKKLVKKKS